MPSSRDPRKTIELLRAKANASGTTPEEKSAIENKINELREKYNTPEKERIEYPSPFIRMTEQEFIDLFHTTPYGVHTVVFPTRAGKSFFFQWLDDMTQENPRANEEGWDIINDS